MNNSKLLLGLSGLVVLMLHADATWAATAGYVQFVYGQVNVTMANGTAHSLQKGEAINEGDTVSTARSASAQIRMQDGGFIAVRPDTQLKFDSFKFTGKKGEAERSFFSLFKGGFRAVTGLVGRVNRQDYRVTTPAATIGIRGTDHETIYLPTAIPGAMAGAYSKVNIGETSLTTNRGTINVLPNQMGFAGGLNQAPQLQPINTTIFTVAVAPTKTIKESKEEKKESDKQDQKVAKQDNKDERTASKESKSDKKEQGNGQNQQGASGEKKGTAGTEQEQQSTVGVRDEKTTVSSESVRGTAVVDNTKLAENINTTVTTTSAAPESKTETVIVTPPAAPQTVLPVTASSGGLTLNATAQTVTAGSTTVSVQDGIYSVQAKTAADAAQIAANAADAAKVAATNANTMLLAIATVSTAPATTAIATATTNIGTATPTVTTAVALTPANATTATNNAISAQATATTASTEATVAQAAITVNGTFADATAIPANTAVQTANTTVQTANTAVQTNSTAVTTQNTVLGTAQTVASSALTSANSSLTTANTALGTANAQNSIIATAQSAAASLLSAAQAAATAANTAALAAQAAATQAATLQAAGDLTGAAAQLTIAQQQQTIAQQQLALAQNAQTALANQLAAAQAAQPAASAAVTNAANAANTAVTAATTAQSQASAATTAATAANNALATIMTQSGTITSNAALVNTNAPIAAYNNPAVASNNFTGHLAMPVPVTPGGYNIAHEQNNSQQANTKFVLDGNGNLVEVRSTSFQVQQTQSLPTTLIANADVKWSGGTAADTFKLVDNSIYAGRWTGATVTVTDLAATAPVAPFSLTPTNSLWAVLLTPTSGYVQSLVATTTYTKAGNTTPFDASGNLGTLNSATLSADFTNQLVSAALDLTMPSGPMAGNYLLTANNMPIGTVASGSGYGAFGGNIAPAITCTGTCAAGVSGYSASVSGSFAGTAAASVGLGYNIWPNAGGPFAAYTPLVAVETTYALSGVGGGSIVAPADLVYVTGAAGGASTSGALSSMTFRDIGGGSGWTSTTSISGGSASSANAPAFATTSIQYGAWTNFTGTQNTLMVQLGGVMKNGVAPSSWMYGPQGYVDTTYMPVTPAVSLSGAMAGTFIYQMDGATAPHSTSSGLTGTLTSASITANFVTMLVSANLGLTMPGNENWGASVTNQPISAGYFTGAATVTRSLGLTAPLTACANCSGTLSGAFTGQNFAGAILSYGLYNNLANGYSEAAGNVALTRVGVAGNTLVGNGVAAPTGNIEIFAPGGLTITNAGGNGFTYPATTTTTTGNILTSYNSSGVIGLSSYIESHTVTCPTCTSTASGQVASSGIYYGNWTAGSYTWSYNHAFSAGWLLPSYWITGPEAGPGYLPQALTGTASYTFDAGQVINSTRVLGTVLGTTALTLDFNKQTVGINLDVSIASTAATPVLHAWNAKTVAGQEAVLGNGQGISGAGFYASLPTITVDGGATVVTNPYAYVNGQLTGTGLTGAIMSFNLGGTLNAATTPTFEYINGVAAFTGTAQAVATSHRYVATTFSDPFAVVPQPMFGLYANNSTRVTQDVTGNLIQFDSQFVGNNSGGNSMTFAKNTSTVAGYGTDAVSGISWGTWAGGAFNATDRATGVVTPVTLVGSLHWIAEPVTTSATTLPLTGTYSYTKVGGTLPTDNLGTVGTLNSATLAANFTAQTVSLGVNATVAGATMNATGTNVPIIQKTAFYASSQEPAASTSYLAVTCTPTTGICDPTLGGTVLGGFTGTGAIGAAMTYGLQNGTSTISGVAAFNTPAPTDIITGYVAFNTAAAPTVGTNPTVGTWSARGHMLLGSTLTGWERGRFNAGNFGDLPNTNFILDGAGNLVRSLHVDYNERFVSGTSPSANHYTDAMVTYSGGVASDRYITPDNNLIIGRWTGGQMTIADNLGALPTTVNDLGLTSSYWFMTTAVPTNYVPQLVGTTSYTQFGATLPTDSFGNVGTMPVASLSADFTAQTVNASVAFTIANKDMTIVNLAIPFWMGTELFEGTIELGTAPTVTCTGTGCSGGGYLGWLTGGMAGAQATSANLAYKAWPTAGADSVVADLIQGVVAFYTATPPTPGPDQAYTPNHIAVETSGGMNFNSGMLANQFDLIYVAGGTSTSGALTSMTFQDLGGGSGWSQTSAITGGTATSANAPAFATTSIQYGEWTGYTGQSNTWTSQLGGKSGGSAPTSWMYGPSGYLDVAYMSGPSIVGAMAGTFIYQMDGATAPKSQNTGLTGTLTSASITANFATNTLNANLALTMPGNENWTASSTAQPISGANFGSGAGGLSVSYGLNAAPTLCATCGGNMNGMFTGQNYAGAIMSYNLYSNFTNSGDNLQGEVALTRNYAGNTNPVVANGAAAPTGNIVVANGYNSVSLYPAVSSTTTGNLLTAYGSSGAGFSNSTTVTCTTCTTTASGQVASSGIYYGNWIAGTFTQSYSSTFTAGTMPPSYWITGPEAGPLYLPQALTGTASYAFNAGQVSNGMGVAGTVLGTTALTLDFNKQTVGINLDVSILSTAATPVLHAWNAKTLAGNEAVLGNGQGIGGAAFYASTCNNCGGGSGLLTVTVDAGVTPVTIYNANVNGQLTGTGLTGAIISFNLNGMLNTATPTVETINGVAAFTGTAQAVATSHRYVATSFYDPFAAVPQPIFGFYANNAARVTQDVAGNLTQFDMQTISNNGGGGSETFASNTSTRINYGTDAVSGISWGRWAGGTFNATDRVTGTVTPVAQTGSLHWIAETVTTSATTLPVVGTYTYVNAGGTTPTDNLGNLGTLNSATLTADFTARTVNVGVNATVNGATLDAVGANVPIIQKTVFYASSQEPASSTSHLTVACTGTCGATLGGTVLGGFAGAGAIGAAMTYGLQNGNSTISGVAAFHR